MISRTHMSGAEKTHAVSHLVMFLLLFMITLAVMRFSTTTGLAVGNHTMNANSIGDFKPFLTAVGLLMAMFIAALIVYSTGGLSRNRNPQPKAEPITKGQKNLDDIDRQLEILRRNLR